MEKIKAFYDKNKKIVIPVAIILVLLIAVGIYFISQPNGTANTKAEHQTEENVDTSQDDRKEENTTEADSQEADNPENDTTEDDKNGAEQSADNAADEPSNDTQVSNNNAGNSGTNSGSSKNGGSSNNGGGNSSSGDSATPTHIHSWKEHTVTEQVWVSNIIPVYETQSVQVGTNKVSEGVFWHCNCGDNVPMSDYKAHTKAHLEAGEPSNGYTEEHFHEEPIYEDQQVQVGTRDDGHYETQTYVDYYYCDCGARK